MVYSIQNVEALSYFTRSVRALLAQRVKRIVLFGSRSRGEATPESDYDVLVVVDAVTADAQRRIDELAGEVLLQFGVVFSAFLTTEETLSRRRFSPFLVNAQKEGVLV